MSINPTAANSFSAANNAASSRGQSAPPAEHTVRRGDTMWGIANSYGVSLQALKNANPNLNPNLIFPGNKVNIPGGATQKYEIQRGDTLDQIAQKFGTTAQALQAANPGVIRNINRIYPGDNIAIPAGGNANGGSRGETISSTRPVAKPDGAGVTSTSADLRPNDASLRAADYARSHVLNGSIGRCYAYVKRALQATGAVNTYLSGVAAKGAGPQLEQQGFVNVLDRPGVNIRSPYDAPTGAVLVYGAAPGATDKNAQYGHIEIRTRDGFASDYFSARARTGDASSGLEGRGRVLIGVYIKPDPRATVEMPANVTANPSNSTTSTSIGGYRTGQVSELYESSNRGPGTVSGGKNDPGGVSYGVYQLASRTGSLQRFLANEGARWAGEFTNKPAGQDAFSTTWRSIANREPAAFRAAQHAFIDRTHFDPAVAGVKAELGVDLSIRHPAVQEATWSVSVQHGGAQKILKEAIRNTDAQMDRSNPNYDRALVQNIYASRTEYVLNVAETNPKLSAGEKQQLIDITQKRYPAELRDVMKLF